MLTRTQNDNLAHVSDEVVSLFWSRVDRSGGPTACWPWTAGKSGGRYGLFCVSGRNVATHRLAWTLAHGPIPDGLFVLHNCPDGDNPACVNPAHLFLGTQTDNCADMRAKGRWRAAYGEKHGMAKLTEQTVREVRDRAVAGEDVESIAQSVGVAPATVRGILSGRSWAHVTGGERIPTTRRKTGRPTRYGIKATQIPLYAPDDLIERIKHEARVRNIRDNSDTWTFSSVAVAVLAREFDIDLTPQDSPNGR